MKVKCSTWVSTNKGSIGIGVVEDDFGKLSIKAAYVTGKSVRYDENLIAQWGGTVSVNDLIAMIGMVIGKARGKKK